MARSAALFLLFLLAGTGPAAAQAVDPVRAALEARIQQLEEELRRLTGRVEELEYQQGQLTTRLERLVASVDERLRTVETAPPAAAREEPPPAIQAPEPPVAAAPPSPPAPAKPPVPGAQAHAPAPDVEPDASAQRGYVLGTIPRDAALAPPPAPTPPPAGAETGYDGALKLLQAGRWPEAEKAFQDFLETNPSDPRASSAAYWLGETRYFRKDYKNAAAAFARNYRTYGPEAPRAPDNLLKLGMSLRALGDREKACQTYAELAKRHPNAPMPVRQTLTRERSAAECA